MTDESIYIGKPVKSLGDNRVGGYLVYFTSAAAPDLDKDFFTANTDFGLDKGYPVVGERTLFHHGAFIGTETTPIGKFVSVVKDDVGLWAEAVLDESNRYVQAVRQLIDQGKLAWSSGALPHSVVTEPVGKAKWIKRWNIIEGSLTPTPAAPFGTRITTVKALMDATPAIELALPPANATASTEAIEAVKASFNTLQKGTKMDVMSIFEAVLRQVGANMSQEEILGLAEAIRGAAGGDVELVEEAEPDTMMAMADDPAANPALAKAVERISGMAVDHAKRAMAAKAAGMFAERAVNAKNLQGSARTIAGGGHQEVSVSGKTLQTGGAPMEIPNLAVKSRLANLTPNQLAFALMIDHRLRGVQDAPRVKFDASGSEQARNIAKGVFAAHAIEASEKGAYFLGDNHAKAFNLRERITKVNETENTQAAGFGEDWVPDSWSEQLWPRARRENVVMSRIRSFQMKTSVQTDPTEASDGTVFLVNEETDAAEFADPTSNSTRIGTDNTVFDVRNKILQRKFLYSYEQIEEGLSFVEGQFESQAARNMLDAFDDVILNGDTETGNTNINNDGTALAATDRRLIFDGIIKYALGATGVNMGGLAPSYAKIVDMLYSLNPEIVGDTRDTIMFVQPKVNGQLIRLDEFVTADKLGGAGASRTGVVPQIAGVDLFLSQQIRASAANGKVNDTPGDNVFGRIAAVYLPYWKLGVYRNIMSYMARSGSGTQYMLTLTARMDLKQHTDLLGASLLYNIGI